MKAQDKAIAWAKIESMVGKVESPILRKSILGELACRAKDEWGYCPSSVDCDTEVKLDDWEQEFLDEVRIASAYGVCMFGDGVHKENENWMMGFVRSGGMLSDLPVGVVSGYVSGLYVDCLRKEGEELFACADFFIK